MPGTKHKTKGDNFERELSAYVNEQTGLETFRTPLSGGGREAGPAMSDVTGTPGLGIEAKRVEKLNFPLALRQAGKNAGVNEAPVVINRRNHQAIGQAYVLLHLDGFLEFYRAWLRVEGYVTDTPARVRAERAQMHLPL